MIWIDRIGIIYIYIYNLQTMLPLTGTIQMKVLMLKNLLGLTVNTQGIGIYKLRD